ncbi:MAG: glycosyltransferase [Rhodothalassiaceae bacterium]
MNDAHPPTKRGNEQNDREARLPQELRLCEDWYFNRYPAAALAVRNGLFPNALQHFLQIGHLKGNMPSPWFATSYVRRQLATFGISTGQEDPRQVYLEHAGTRPLNCHWLISELYLDRCLAPFGDGMNGQRRTGPALVRGAELFRSMPFRPSPFFHATYLRMDLRERLGARQAKTWSDWEILNWFLENLSLWFQTASVLFDPDFYCERYGSVRTLVGAGRTYATPLHHLVETGLDQDWAPLPDFDIDFYRKRYPCQVDACTQAGQSLTAHFLFEGISRNHNPNQYFDADYYVSNYPDVGQEIARNHLLGAFEHFLLIGRKRNYKARQPLVSMSVPEEFSKALFEKQARQLAHRVLSNRLKVTFPQRPKPEVSVIIPVHNQFDFTIKLLAELSVLARLPLESDIEVVVVDNGSTDQTTRLPDLIDTLTYIRTEDRLGYPKACNLGASRASANKLLFVNNDISIRPGAIAACSDLLEDADIGAVGAKLILTNGELQEAGGIIWSDGTTAGFGRGDDPTDPRYGYRRDVDYCSGCFLMVDAALFRQLGGFEEAFSPGYYEETDLCVRIWGTGKRVVYQPDAEIEHYEFASYGSGRPPSVPFALMAKHRRLFIERNRPFLAKQCAPHQHSLSYAGTQRSRRPHVLLVEDLIPDPRFGSGFSRTFSIIKQFLQRDWRVSVYILHHRPTDFGRALTDLGVRLIEYRDRKLRLIDLLTKAGDDFDLLWVTRTHNFVHIPSFAKYWRSRSPNGKIVADAEAIDTLRTRHLRRTADLPAALCLETELVGLEEVDGLVVVNTMDRDAVAPHTAAPLHVLGHQLDLSPTPARFEDREHLLFCGSVHDDEAPNLDSLLWFSREVLPRLVAEQPAIILRVVGYWREGLDVPEQLSSNHHIEMLGAREDLRPYFDTARVFVAPTRFAGGVPHKVHQAFSFGLPCVVTTIIRDQLATDGTAMQDVPVLAAPHESPELFARHCLDLYTSPQDWMRIRQAGLDFAQDWCGSEQFAGDLAAILESLDLVAKHA